MKLRILFAVLFVLCVLAPPTKADTFNLSGIGFYGGNSADLIFQGGGFATSFGPQEGPSLFGFCQQGSPCDITRTIFAFPPTEVVNLNGTIIPVYIRGSFVFSGSADIPPGAVDSSVQLLVPVTISGVLMIFERTPQLTQGDELFEIMPIGPGFVTLVGDVLGNCNGQANCDRFFQGTYRFDAVATSVPEPASLLLFASGLVGMGALIRQRRRKAL